MNKKNIKKIKWDEVDAVPESKYDYDEAPELTVDFFKRAELLMPDDRKNINIRVKKSTIDFFKKHSKHYQTMINAILDAYVETKMNMHNANK